MISINIPPYEGRGYRINAGQYLRVTDVEGNQIADWIAINQNDISETLSGPETLNFAWRSRLRIDDTFWSSKRRPMFRVVADDTNGYHNMTHAPCSKEFYELVAQDPDHPNCRTNLLNSVSEYGVSDDTLPNTVNLFQNTPPGADGGIDAGPGTAQAGQSIIVEALMDCFGAVSSCSVDVIDENNHAALGTVNGIKCTPIQIDIFDRDELQQF